MNMTCGSEEHLIPSGIVVLDIGVRDFFLNIALFLSKFRSRIRIV
jgi:hypothetical protein